ncbi:hypothetical protein NM208_g8764 [Fusarium decemcellulare]|uniref:Uncharacterized protein n=2 Tax=Fusarium decemcellulare TaxID=57161 RepID=A0ACC1S0U5_9HYPO|nr:hypothetical protein NM208_g9699 [Fusarium decemcellulare]KAJ3531703.1 hypothetical protein NM208_g8764 [Fusarium decemcellulare]
MDPPFTATFTDDQLNSLPSTEAILSASDDELYRLYLEGPVLYKCGASKVVQLSKDLIIKGGRLMTLGEAEAQSLAAKLGFRTPAVHRIFQRVMMGSFGEEQDCWFMVMDFIQGQVLDKLWPSLDAEARQDMAKRTIALIEKLQSTSVGALPPGPVGGSQGEPWEGPFFTQYGTGPFASMLEMQDWYNHKLDVCIQLTRISPDSPRFEFDQLALTHQDIAPRNIIVEKDTEELVLIDWAMAGIYPTGLEQAALLQQGPGEWDYEFVHTAQAEMPEGYDKLCKQLGSIMYGLTTGAFL